MDAVPKGGAVRYIRQPDADPRALDALLGGVAHQARPEELEDAFMMMLRQHQDAGRVRAAYGAAGRTTWRRRPRPPGTAATAR